MLLTHCLLYSYVQAMDELKKLLKIEIINFSETFFESNEDIFEGVRSLQCSVIQENILNIFLGSRRS